MADKERKFKRVVDATNVSFFNTNAIDGLLVVFRLKRDYPCYEPFAYKSVKRIAGITDDADLSYTKI